MRAHLDIDDDCVDELVCQSLRRSIKRLREPDFPRIKDDDDAGLIRAMRRVIAYYDGSELKNC